jgi:4-amino-4-deoxy-L-arabinose transferase-like glycosyltransferase
MLTITNANKGRMAVFAGLMILAAVSAGWRLSAEALNDHECFVSVTAREMLANGNWIEPTYNGQPRLQKTPLSYWLVAGLGKITGKINEVTARLPSAIFAFLSVGVIVYFVNRWLSFRIAIISAAIWATSEGYIIYSHSARQDMVMSFFIVVCFLSFYSAITEESRKRQVVYGLIFWVSFGLANLAKGPEPIPLVIVPLFVYIAVFRQWKQIPKLLPVWGALIFVVITLAWPIAVAYKVNWDIGIWKKEFIDRFFGEYAKGNYPVYFYFSIMFKYITPWFAFLPMALAAPFFRVWAEKQRVMLFLWIVFVTDFVFLTISGGKRQQYILAVMPAIIILAGILLEDIAFVRRAHTVRFAVNFFKGHIVAALAISVLVLITVFWADSKWQTLVSGVAAKSFSVCKTSPQLHAFIIGLCAMALIAAGIVTLMFAKHKPAMGCAVIFSSIVLFVMVCSVGIEPIMDVNDCTREFALKIASVVPQTDKVVARERMSGKFLHYTGRVIPEVADKEALYQDYQNGDWIVATGKQAEELAKDVRFRRVYYNPKEEFYQGKWTGGALFHKSGPMAEDTK